MTTEEAAQHVEDRRIMLENLENEKQQVAEALSSIRQERKGVARLFAGGDGEKRGKALRLGRMIEEEQARLEGLDEVARAGGEESATPTSLPGESRISFAMASASSSSSSSSSDSMIFFLACLAA